MGETMFQQLKSLVKDELIKQASAAHPGFGREAGAIERKEGYGKATADKILAVSARKASASAVKKNPHLKHVSEV